MATYTATTVEKFQAKTNSEAGVHGIVSTYINAVGLAAGSVVQMMRVPDRAYILDGWVLIPPAHDTNFLIGAGTSESAELFLRSASCSTSASINFYRFWEMAGHKGSAAMAALAGYQVSLSADQIKKWTAATITIGSAAATGTFKMFLKYSMDAVPGQI